MRIVEKTFGTFEHEITHTKNVVVQDVVYQLFKNRGRRGAIESVAEKVDLLIELIIPLIEKDERAIANLCDVATRELYIHNTYTLEKEHEPNLDKK
jgi:hypothetical protein